MAAPNEAERPAGERSPGPWIPTGEIPAFPTTRWTQVQEAAGDGTEARQALEAICREYWYPLYGFARRSGNSPEDAQDLTQGFFAKLLRGDSLERVDRDKGRLRSYLLGGLKHFMVSEWRKGAAERRGGADETISIDAEAAEERLAGEAATEAGLEPDRAFDRFWALEILDRVLNRLRAEYDGKGKDEQFEKLSQFLGWNDGEESYQAVGDRIGMTEGAVKVAVHRMRKRYGELLREEIAQTVSKPEEIEDELDALIAALQ